jgi:hypothetical protein
VIPDLLPRVQEGSLLHRLIDLIPLLTAIGTVVALLLRSQTRHIKSIVEKMTTEHNKNGAAHVVVASALRAERGQLFQQVAEELNKQGDRLADNREGIARIEERLGALIESHNATISSQNEGGDGVRCALRPMQVRTPDPSYTGPYRRKTDPGRA